MAQILTTEFYDWSEFKAMREDVRLLVSSSMLPWRETKTGLMRSDKPGVFTLKKHIEINFNATIRDWWVTRQDPGADGTLLHGHHTTTWIYYPWMSTARLLGEEWSYEPISGGLVVMPPLEQHRVEASKGIALRYSLVFSGAV